MYERFDESGGWTDRVGVEHGLRADARTPMVAADTLDLELLGCEGLFSDPRTRDVGWAGDASLRAGKARPGDDDEDFPGDEGSDDEDEDEEDDEEPGTWRAPGREEEAGAASDACLQCKDR